MQGIKIENKKSKYPIIQGGMGVGVSLHKLAGHVSKEGGIGVISTADIGYQEPDFNTNPLAANLRAIGSEIKKAREIAAGGIWDNKDINKFLELGADGVQMATRFVTTYECDASNEFKEAYINAKEEDIKIISSPVGMPGRALYNEFIKSTENEKSKTTKCYKCIKTCDIKNTPYCITKALINSVKGNLKEGLIFCGSNVDKVKELMTVHDLMEELAGV